jgi:uncharacterized membrane protein YcaP (DUF421 family)
MRAFSMPDWGQVFVPDLSLLESFVRGSAVYLSLVVLFRIVLKRQAGSLALTDVMLVVLISECASPALSAEAKSVPNGLVAVAALLFWNYVLDRLAYHWPWLQRLLEPRPLQLVKDGKLVRENMDAESITDEELEAQLREHGIDDVSKVKAAYIESEGNVSVIPKDDHKPSPAPDGTPEPTPETPDFDEAVRKYLAATDELRAAVTWHESQAGAHHATAKAARELLSRRGARPGRSAKPKSDD